MRRSELGRRINGVSPLLHPRESILMDLHQNSDVLFKMHHPPLCVLQKKLWFWNETIQNIELFIILKIGNWPTKSAGGIKGGGGATQSRFF